MGALKSIKESGQVLNYLLVLGFLGIVWLMIYGNMSGNLGFTTNSEGYNNTQTVITNITTGVRTFFNFSNTFFTITAIVLLITILLGLLFIVMKLTKGFGKSESGYA